MMTANNNESENGRIDRRQFLTGLGVAGLTVATMGIRVPGAAALTEVGSLSSLTPGLNPPNAAHVARMPVYRGPWNAISRKPFAGFDFALGYIAEGIDTGDPLQPFPNPSGLFETVRGDIPSAVGGNETPDRSAEFWYKDILGWSDERIIKDFWSAINWARRMWGLDLDNPATDGYVLPDGSAYSYPGSPSADNQLSIWSPRIAVDGKGGLVRMAPTLLAPNVGYTVVFRAGRLNPNYTGGTTAMSPEDPGKVRDGGVWGGTVNAIDVLAVIQAVANGSHTYTTPSGSSNAPAQWGQWWRRAAAITGVDIAAIDPNSDPTSRPAPRPSWPIGYLDSGTDFFWGNYNLKFGRREETITLHYESQVPTRFRDFDGIPEAFICELVAHPGGTDMPQSQIDQGFKDVDGSLSGFPDFNDPGLNGQNPFGLGRVHGTSYPRGRTSDGRATFHLRNWLLFPPRLNSAYTINNSIPGIGPLDFS